MRSGTLDVPGAVGLAVATPTRRPSDGRRTAARVAGLRDALVAGVVAGRPGRASCNGHPTERLPGIAHLSFPGCEGDALLMLLDARGVECSTGSACSAGVAQPSHVLLAMGADRRTTPAARCASRSGHNSTAADVDAVVDAIGPGGRARPPRPGVGRLVTRGVDEGAGRDERRGRLRGGRGARGRRRARRHRRAPGAVGRARRRCAPAPAAAARSRTPTTPAGPPTCSASRSTSGISPSGSAPT